MPDLPARPDLDQVRRQAKDLLRAAETGDADALRRIRAVSDQPRLAAAQLAIAREYGFASWPQLKTEVLRRAVLDSGDPERLRGLLDKEPELAFAPMEHWCDHPNGASPLGYVAMSRYATSHGLWRDVAGAEALARALVEKGAPVDGEPDDPETPLITAASYGNAAVARVLIEAGANVDARAEPNAGGVPGGTALAHAAVFGMTEVVDILLAAGARPSRIEEAAAAGDVTAYLTPQPPLQARVRALVMAADHQRLAVMDQLLEVGTPIDATDAKWGRQALRVAAHNGRIASVEYLLARGADPNVRDPEHKRTALEWCLAGRDSVADPTPHARVQAILRPVTTGG